MLVMEGGLSIDIGALRSVGPIAFAIAVSGTMLPIALGSAYMSACGYGVMAGVAAGTSLSSTSIGMATKVLQTLGELSSPLGNLVCVAAMVDDVLSLVILAVVSNVEGDDQGGGRDVAWMTSRPILASVGICALGTGLAVATPRVAAMNQAIAPGGKTPSGSGFGAGAVNREEDGGGAVSDRGRRGGVGDAGSLPRRRRARARRGPRTSSAPSSAAPRSRARRTRVARSRGTPSSTRG